MPLHFVRGQALVVEAFLFLGYEAVLLEPLAQVTLAAGGQQRLDGRLEEIRIAANTRHDGSQTTNLRARHYYGGQRSARNTFLACTCGGEVNNEK